MPSQQQQEGGGGKGMTSEETPDRNVLLTPPPPPTLFTAANPPSTFPKRLPPTLPRSDSASSSALPAGVTSMPEGYSGEVKSSRGGSYEARFLPEKVFADAEANNSDAHQQDLHAPKRHGRGLMVYGDRTVYEGDWVDDERHGFGLCYFPTGNIYIGSFVRGHMEGNGSMLYHDGDFFTGMFHASMCHGVGVYYSGGTEIRGEWRNGVRVSVQRRPLTSIEDFDAQRIHYQTFSAVLKQLHGHFSYYALFDNRFKRSVDDESGMEEPSHPAAHLTSSTANEFASKAIHPQPSPTATSTRAATTKTTGGGSTKQLLPPPLITAHGAESSDSAPPGNSPTVARNPRVAGPEMSTTSTPPLGSPQHQRKPSVLDVPVSSDEDPFVVQSTSGRKISLTTVAATDSAGGGGGGGGERSSDRVKLSRKSKRRAGAVGIGRDSVLATSGTSGAAGAATAVSDGASDVAASGNINNTPPPMQVASPTAPNNNNALAATTGGVTAVVVGNANSNEPFSARLHRTASKSILFSTSGPMANEHFSLMDYLKYAGIFLCPVFSIPHLPSCPFTMTGLDMEREYVVSGAALSHDFKPPKTSVYVALVGMMVHATAIIVSCARTGATSRMQNDVLFIEVVAPAVLWVVFAFVCAGYHGFSRVAHALERLDRHLAPKIAAYAANAVDATAEICVFTWDDEGRSKITNAHYKYRWLLSSMVIGVMAAFACAVTRAAFGQSAFLIYDPYHASVAGLTLISMFFFVTGICYYVLKATDMQRQVLSQLQVLTKLVYLDGVALTSPSEHRQVRFDFDGPLDVNDFFSGFVGWWVTRSFVLGSSACSNHQARSACLSAFIIGHVVMCLVVIGDIVYAGATHQIHTSTSPFSSDSDGLPYFTGAHSLALVLVTMGGVLMMRYLTACLATRQELKQHINILDVAALYQSVSRKDQDASHVIQMCRSMIQDHDAMPSVLTIDITPGIVLLLCSINVLAFAMLWVLFADAFSTNGGSMR